MVLGNNRDTTYHSGVQTEVLAVHVRIRRRNDLVEVVAGLVRASDVRIPRTIPSVEIL